MTENAQANLSGSQTQNVSPSSAPVETSQQKYTDADVDRIVADKKQKWQEQNTRNDSARTEMNSNARPMETPTAPQNVDIDKLVEDKVHKLSQVYQQQQQQQFLNQQAQKVTGEINAKLNDSRSRYGDFDKVVTPAALSEMPDLSLLANGVENTGDVMYDLLNNPTKVANINSNLMAAKIYNSSYYYQLAQKQMQEISESVKRNQTAKANEPNVKEPLSQNKPSNLGMDNGSQTIRDWRDQEWLRG